ncbi:hypothetical protein M406DRAFT_58845 [Cryphonectria parasitica EP155]|uniref:Carboxylic ester hydrolase n=1 Tax=Cryphonectria parasitica (strain ATCC 38755 / EP155) TaxID=660469 RepID=A0A9P4Y9R3_CRYP1|nr:uncharacterized protein M406DRAFT_58845 [Cryphonectria parasitica EP155]KAF3769552.1 hypothetical protein M406DRAFT_58845 [Cryphonectria parasitica EP155]
MALRSAALLLCSLHFALGTPPVSQFDPDTAGIANATVTNHAFIGAGTSITLTGNDASCAQTSQTVPVDLCRVSLQISTSNRSGVVAEVWLPEDWNGRLVTTGNGGLGGCIDYASIAYTSQNGFASVGTNNGHNGTSGIQFLNNADVVTDFAWRAVHVGVETGKAMLSPFYGQEANRSYYLGCSLGGRQAIKAADMFPDDFDGISAGCPAVDFNNLYSWRASFYPTTGANGSANFIPTNVWETTIHDEVLRQCDTIDGVADGIIEDSSLCRFDPDALLCGTVVNSSACLTSAQVDIVRTIFSPYDWQNGTLLYPAMNPGSEILAAAGLYDGQPWALSEGWFRYAVYNNPSWDPANYSLADAEVADEVNPGNIRTWPDTLSDFQSRGGKLIMYHGGQDNQISSFNSPRYYEYLRAGMNYSTDQMDEFIRFFRISGMFHCETGPGAWVIGQLGGAAAQGPFDREHNVLAALVAWVEQGAAPDTLTGTKYVNDTASAGVDFERAHCRWPLRNTYLGEDLGG